MAMRIDHVVLWVADPPTSVEWYVRVDAHRAGKAMFRKMAPAMTGMAAGGAGNKVNHVCFAMSTRSTSDVRRATSGSVIRLRTSDAGGRTSVSLEARSDG